MNPYSSLYLQSSPSPLGQIQWQGLQVLFLKQEWTNLCCSSKGFLKAFVSPFQSQDEKTDLYPPQGGVITSKTTCMVQEKCWVAWESSQWALTFLYFKRCSFNCVFPAELHLAGVQVLLWGRIASQPHLSWLVHAVSASAEKPAHICQWAGAEGLEAVS